MTIVLKSSPATFAFFNLVVAIAAGQRESPEKDAVAQESNAAAELEYAHAMQVVECSKLIAPYTTPIVRRALALREV